MPNSSIPGTPEERIEWLEGVAFAIKIKGHTLQQLRENDYLPQEMLEQNAAALFMSVEGMLAMLPDGPEKVRQH